MSTRLFLFAALAAASSCVPFATAASGDFRPQGSQQAKQEQKQEEPKKDPKVEAYEKAVKDLPRFEGPFTLYLNKKEIWLELPEAQLGKLFCLQAAFDTGVMSEVLQAGFPAGDFTVDVFRFERYEDAVWLVRPALKRRWEKDDPLALAAERSFPEAILGSYRILQTHPEKHLLLVNVTNLFFGEPLRLSEAVNALLGGTYGLDTAKSMPDRIQGFPENTIVRMKLHYLSQRGGGSDSILSLLGLSGGTHLEDTRSAPIVVTFNLWFRRDTGYMPRVADPRVGYFTTDFFNLARFSSDDRTERWIARMDLRKKNPSADVSEPVKPIVWYIDPSVPKPYRKACAEGILYWNRAFEAIGYKDAIQVKFVEDGDKDWGHSDGRFNVLRWTMSEGAAYAICMPRIDPMTGQILSASINLDANVLQAAFKEYERFSNPGADAAARALEILTRNDERDEKVGPFEYIELGVQALRAKEARSAFSRLGWSRLECQYGMGKAETAAFAWNALMAISPQRISREEYAKEFLRDIIAHETGHSFGLRHNFVGSTLLTPEELADDEAITAKGMASSVMDYTPVNVMAVVKGARSFYAPRIGEYDIWAIRYGYMDVPNAATPLGERYALSRVASLSGQPQYRFMTDEEADMYDPYVVRFDNSRDPIRYSSFVLEAADRVKKYAIEKLPRPGESYAKRTQLIVMSLNRCFREAQFAARFVGGVVGNRNFKGDVGQQPTLAPVDAAKQREAIRVIVRSCLSSRAFELPQEVLLNLSQDAFGTNSGWTAPLREIVGMQQMALYSALMSASTTRRIAENAYKLGRSADAYTLPEHFSTLLGAVFSEVGADKSVSPTRRDLQRFALNALMVQAGAQPGGVSEDVRMLASDALRRLSARFGAQLARPGKLDEMTRIHLRDSKETIDRFLSRTNVVSR